MGIGRGVRRSVFLCSVMFFLYGQVFLFMDAIPILGIIFSIVRVALFVSALALFFWRFTVLKYEGLLLLYSVIIFLITALKGGDLVVLASHFMNVAILWVLFKLYYRNEPVLFLKCSSIVLSIFAYVNFILTLLFPNGLMSSKFLLGGNYNQMGAILLLTMVVHAVYCQLKGRYDFNMFSLVVVSLITVLFVGSMTSSVSLILFSLFLLIAKSRISHLLFNVFFVSVVLMNIGLLVLQISIENSYVVYFIEDVLHKDLTFSGRVSIWIEAVDMISRSFLFGYGMRSMEWYDFHFNALTPHNFIISLFLKGGIVIFLLFALLVGVAVNRARIYNNNIIDIVMMSSCILLLMMTMETYPIFIVFFLMFMMYFAPTVYYYMETKEQSVL